LNYNLVALFAALKTPQLLLSRHPPLHYLLTDLRDLLLLASNMVHKSPQTHTKARYVTVLKWIWGLLIVIRGVGRKRN